MLSGAHRLPGSRDSVYSVAENKECLKGAAGSSVGQRTVEERDIKQRLRLSEEEP